MITLLLIGFVLSQFNLISSNVVGASALTAEANHVGPGSRQMEPLFGSATSGEVDSEVLAWCEDLVVRTFAVLPTDHVDAVHNLTFSFDPEMRRGLAGGNTLILRCTGVDEAELVAVLVHELGHVVDTGLLQAENHHSETSFDDRGNVVYGSDPSADYYGLSWMDNRSFTASSSESSFVSLYAMTSPYEDFAESYAAYVLHGPLLRFYAAHNDDLKEKYEFMRDHVFAGVEYDFAPEGLPSTLEADRRVYDITRLTYDLESFWRLGAADST